MGRYCEFLGNVYASASPSDSKSNTDLNKNEKMLQKLNEITFSSSL